MANLVVPGVQEIPDYLRPFIVEQDASLYTPIDHASWRFILKISRRFFSEHAHEKYLSGLEETGISLERIPLISEMNERLKKFGWRAVAVSGFIPPAVFMEFLSLGVLPIACDMRKLENLAYTPAPDIVHEAAGHAPIIADEEYAAYLHNYGEISRKAIFSTQDLAVYQAVRKLSDVKENPASTPQEIKAAQAELDRAGAAVDHVSEATQLARMSWWTIEYGLVGSPKNPKLYGAGLLSSVSESYHCLGSEIKKIPFTLDCINMSYDITKPQPQLYLAKDFGSLNVVLEQLADTMAFRRGGMESLQKALKSGTVTTALLDSGVQISGVLSRVREKNGEAIYLQYQGPSQLSYAHRELEGHGTSYHSQGFGTAIGHLESGRNPASLKLQAGRDQELKFQSGIKIRGKLKTVIEQNGHSVVLSFDQCTVTLGSEVLFDPSWGNFDLACGSKVISVFAGAADRKNYLASTGGFKQEPQRPKTNLTAENRELNELYARVRKIRENGSVSRDAELEAIWAELKKKYPQDWLLPIEILELSPGASFATAIREQLELLSGQSSENRELIRRGLESL
jgi:phenylalanine-4-hydroxylase